MIKEGYISKEDLNVNIIIKNNHKSKKKKSTRQITIID